MRIGRRPIMTMRIKLDPVTRCMGSRAVARGGAPHHARRLKQPAFRLSTVRRRSTVVSGGRAQEAEALQPPGDHLGGAAVGEARRRVAQPELAHESPGDLLGLSSVVLAAAHCLMKRRHGGMRVCKTPMRGFPGLPGLARSPSGLPFRNGLDIQTRGQGGQIPPSPPEQGAS